MPAMIPPHLLIRADARDLACLPDGIFQACVTSPPYFNLRDYGDDRQIGLEETPENYVAALVDVFREVRRTLRDDGTLWLNIGSSYAGGGRGNYCSDTSKQATNVGANIIPVAVSAADETFALRDDLTVDELAYVLSELAAHVRQGHEVAEPDRPV